MTRLCKKCGEEKGIEEFYLNTLREGQKKRYRNYSCKDCWAKCVDKDKRRRNYRKWRSQNKIQYKLLRDKYLNKEVITENGEVKKNKRLRYEKDRSKLANGEIRKRLKNLGFHQEQITPEIIALKRALIKLKRILKNEKSKDNQRFDK
jgi:hypothetical protein